MEKETFNPTDPFMYCPNCAEKISRQAVVCPKCQQRVLRESRWPIFGLVIGIIFSVVAIIGVLAAIAIPAYQQYVSAAEDAQIIEEQDNENQQQLENFYNDQDSQ